MSLIIYRDRMLTTDSQGTFYHLIYEPQNFQVKKIHVSPCQRLAFAYAGEFYTPDFIFELQTKLIQRAIEFSETGRFGEPSKEEFKWFDDTPILVMTAGFAFTFYRGEYKLTSDNFYNVIGSAVERAIVLLNAFKTPKETIEWLANVDPLISLPIQEYKASDLKPLIQLAPEE